jgi:hypothetical protein
MVLAFSKGGAMRGFSVGIFMVFSLGISVGCKHPLADQVRHLAFEPVNPPHSGWVPGSIWEIRTQDANGLSANPVCSPGSSVGNAKSSTYQSLTSLAATLQKTNKFTLDGTTVNSLNANINVQLVSSVTTNLSNIKIQSMTLNDIYANTMDGSCKEAIKQEQANKLFVILESLIADVQYTIKYDNSVNITAEAKKEALSQVLQNLGADISGGISLDNSGQISGTGKELVLGVHSHEVVEPQLPTVAAPAAANLQFYDMRQQLLNTKSFNWAEITK